MYSSSTLNKITTPIYSYSLCLSKTKFDKFDAWAEKIYQWSFRRFIPTTNSWETVGVNGFEFKSERNHEFISQDKRYTRQVWSIIGHQF